MIRYWYEFHIAEACRLMKAWLFKVIITTLIAKGYKKFRTVVFKHLAVKLSSSDSFINTKHPSTGI